MYTQKENTQFFVANQPKTDKKASKRKLILTISACVVLTATVAMTLFSIESAFSLKYEHAVALMGSDTLMAKEEFLKIGGYKDSSVKAQECQKSIDYDSADAKLASGDYSGARVIFLRLGDFGDASGKVLECDYAAATVMMNDGKYEEAEAAFSALSGFSDSSRLARQCQNEINYIAAAELLSQKDYETALIAFKALGNFKDSSDKVQECQINLDYIAADLAFSEGKFYTAYLAFTQLGSFSDSAQRAAACERPKPASGQIYRDPRYKNKTCPITITAPKDGYSTFIKIYMENDLVSTVFIAPGKKVTVSLPAGYYVIKEAVGTKWYGTDEAFGDDAYYGVMNDGATIRLKSGWEYTITLRAQKGNVEDTDIGRTDF